MVGMQQQIESHQLLLLRLRKAKHPREVCCLQEETEGGPGDKRKETDGPSPCGGIVSTCILRDFKRGMEIEA